MTSMTMEFDGVRELSVEEIEEVNGGSRIRAVGQALQYLGRVARDTAVGQAMIEGANRAGEALENAAKDAYANAPREVQQGLAMVNVSRG